MRDTADLEWRAAAHDLRAPLLTVTSYLGLIELGAFGPISAEAKAAVRQCASVAGRAQTIVETTLRGGAGAPTTVDLQLVITEVQDALAARIRETDATIEVASRLPLVQGEPVALFRVFENVLQNAIKYAIPGQPPRITISTRPLDHECVEIAIRDYGRGLPPAEQDGVLRTGVRGTTAGEAEGLGLGLATVSRLVASLGGSITLQSPAEGPGLIASLTLRTAEGT